MSDVTEFFIAVDKQIFKAKKMLKCSGLIEHLIERLLLWIDFYENFLAIGFKEKLLLWKHDEVGSVCSRNFYAEIMSFWCYLIF